MIRPEAYALFPRWILHSGLAMRLATECKTPNAWLLFRTLVEMDCEASPSRPGIVEASFGALGERAGLEPKKVETALKKLRKAGVVRCFLPDNEEEEGLYQIAAPLETPVAWEEVRRSVPGMLDLPDHAFRYALAPPDEVPSEVALETATPGGDGDDAPAADPKLRAVIDLYLDNVSMKMNALILDELRLIAARFDLPLVRKVFARAKAKEVQGLSWILAEIRREQRIKEKAAERRKKPGFEG